ncbi:MAG: hypothetical protein ISS31_08875 [Kiritimatiellae bacterium]|nr:hypothetical protein [Kiritimatiellia bacterium]
MKRIMCVCVMLFVLVTGVDAANGDAGLSLKLGTPGIGVDLTLGVSEKVNVRLSGNFFSYTYDDFEFDEEDEEIDEVVDTVEVALDLMSLGALVDWHPWGGGFRLSGGAFYNGNEVSLSVTAGDTITIDDEEYEVQSLDGQIDFSAFAPYAGIGWGNAATAESRWHFAFDLGVMLQGSADISLKATATDPTLQNQLNAALENEAQDLEDDAESFTLYPVLALGLSYTF